MQQKIAIAIINDEMILRQESHDWNLALQGLGIDGDAYTFSAYRAIEILRLKRLSDTDIATNEDIAMVRIPANRLSLLWLSLDETQDKEHTKLCCPS
jgi:hypothetical protein